jgi:leucyl aminopeptidase
MEIRVETTPLHETATDWLIVPVWEEGEFNAATAALDSALGGQLTRLKERGDLTGKLAEIVVLPDVPAVAAKRLLPVGLGKPDQTTLATLDRALMTAVRKASEKKDVTVAVALPDATPAVGRNAAAEIAATALTVGCVGQGLYQAQPSRHPFGSCTVLAGGGDGRSAIEAAVKRGRTLGEAVNLTRDLVNRMADEIFPESVAHRAEAVAKDCGLTIRILDEKQLKAEKMGSLLAVAVGSERPPRMVVLEYRGGGKDAPTLALVGKGVTFDSGGLSLKPTDSMKTMKCDMAGAATVLGAMTAVARMKVPVNVTGYLGLVENMVSGASYKLGDVLKARNGVTIEVLNTDAEGRLVLADVLCYAVDHGADRIIDLATLTGSCVVALGEEITGVFANDQPWADAVQAAAKAVGEKTWQMPMDEQFAELLKSDVADCKNVGPRWGGAITAAKFLEKFVGGKPWVHLDIAGPAFAESCAPHREGGATGCMVRTLVEVARRFGTKN